MRILFFTSPTEDYLPDSLLHGLKSLYGTEVVDFPKCEILYRNCPEEVIAQIRGRGFTLYSGLLEDLPVNRFHIFDRIRKGEFDLVVFSSIWRQFGWFVQLRPWLDPRKTVLMDGEDTSAAYPAAGLWWRRPYYWFLPRAHHRFLYFKREWTSDTRFSLFSKLVPHPLKALLPSARNLRRISFSIPEEKIVRTLPLKTKDFPIHIVDPEVAALVPGSHSSYAFTSEVEYYADLQASRFGITTKRAGWDCLRHYEIAANGAVPCFRDLAIKPTTCAPHGLDASNSLSYNSVEDLQKSISELKPSSYAALQAGAIRWAHDHSTVALAHRVLFHVSSLQSR